MRFRRRLLAVLLHGLWLVPASAQTTGGSDVLSRAAALSAAGQYPAVVALLDPYVRQHPADAGAWLLLAQHRYWSRDAAGARRSYEAALLRHPARPELRLAYARLLMETGDSGAALDVLRPLGAEHPDAESLRGTIAWWAGDLAAAARYFRSALDSSPAHPEAASGLASIRAGARPWIRVAGRGGRDSQPLSQGAAAAEAGFFFTPLQSLRAEVIHTRFATERSLTPVTLASAGYRGFWPAARLETELVAGVASRPDGSGWTGRLEAGFRLPHGVRAGGRWERAPYLYTVASLTESVMISAVQASVSADRAGWLGEAVVRRERFPDANTMAVFYGWLMAPLVRTNAFTLQAGYAYGYQHAAEHRFTPVMTSAPTPRRPPTWEGRYVPYYTPVRMQAHSVTGSLVLQPIRAVTVRGGGSYGFAGSEQAPYVYLAGRAPVTGLYEHPIRPWNARGSVSAALGPAVTLQLEGSHLVTSWYDASTVNISLHARF